MDNSITDGALSARVARELPCLRSYARALTGTQPTGDALVAAALEAIVEDRSFLDRALDLRVALHRAFHWLWNRAGAPVDTPGPARERAAQRHMAELTPNSREALLLNTLQKFGPVEIAQIMQIPQTEVPRLLERARREMERSVAGKVLIIEDEAETAMEIHSIVTEMGHQVTGIGRTRDGAVRLGMANRPDLVIADSQIADNASGVDAVRDLLKEVGQIPIIFFSAFPERLLTGEGPEPAFVVAKPYTEDQIRSAVSQAMFFAATEPLEAG